MRSIQRRLGASKQGSRHLLYLALERALIADPAGVSEFAPVLGAAVGDVANSFFIVSHRSDHDAVWKKALTSQLFGSPIPCALGESCVETLPDRVNCRAAKFRFRWSHSEIPGSQVTRLIRQEFTRQSKTVEVVFVEAEHSPPGKDQPRWNPPIERRGSGSRSNNAFSERAPSPFRQVA